MIFSDFVNAPPSENGGLRRFLRRKNRIENEEGRGFGRGTALEQSESGAGQNIGPGGAAGAFSPEKALPGMELAGGGVPGGLPGAGMPVQGGAGLFPGMGPAMA